MSNDLTASPSRQAVDYGKMSRPITFLTEKKEIQNPCSHLSPSWSPTIPARSTGHLVNARRRRLLPADMYGQTAANDSRIHFTTATAHIKAANFSAELEKDVDTACKLQFLQVRNSERYLFAVLLCVSTQAIGPQMVRVMVPVVFFIFFLLGSAEAMGYRRMLQANVTAPAPNSGSACSVNVCDFYFEGYKNSVPVFQYVTQSFFSLSITRV